MTLNNSFQPDILITPGVTLLETIEAIGMSQAELSIRMQRPEKTISGIINGSTSITPETALQLERVLGTPANFWIRLQSTYDEHSIRLNILETINKEFNIANTFPYAEMVKRGWIEATKKVEEKTENLLKFFGVETLSVLPQLGYHFRKLDGKKVSEEALAVWLRKGEKEGLKIQTNSFNKTRLKEIVYTLRNFTVQNPQEFDGQMREMLASCGVAYVAIPMMTNTYVNGAAKWLSPDKALIEISLRGSYADIFWFTIFHELGHVLLHGKKDSFVDTDNVDRTTKENEANDFASEILIPKDKYLSFVKKGQFDATSIKEFALEINIHPGIIVGRLQHHKHIGYNQLNSLRVRYQFGNNN